MMWQTIKWWLTAGFLAGALAACDRQEGPMEEAGEEIDQTMEEAGEKAGEAMEEAGDVIEETTDKANP